MKYDFNITFRYKILANKTKEDFTNYLTLSGIMYYFQPQ